MRTSDLIILGGIAIAGYWAYKKFLGSNPEASKDSISASMDSTRKPTADEKERNWTAGQSELITTSGNTTYFWSKDDIADLTGYQRFLLNIGINPRMVVG